jgi:lipopolysaccharide export system protein LptC
VFFGSESVDQTGGFGLAGFPDKDEGREPVGVGLQELVQRFAADGSLRLQIEGEEARHYPDTDTLEISNVTLRGQNPNGQRNDVFSANNMQLNSKSGEYELTGQVRGVIAPGKP